MSADIDNLTRGEIADQVRELKVTKRGWEELMKANGHAARFCASCKSAAAECQRAIDELYEILRNKTN